MVQVVGYCERAGEPGQALSVVLASLKVLAHSGFDSAGLGVVGKEGRLVVRKAVDNLDDLGHGDERAAAAHVGIGHLRWATHGPPTKENAHPQVSNDGKVAVVHNGVVENEVRLKQELQGKGFTFASQTDTEVLANLVQHVMSKGVPFTDAVAQALTIAHGPCGAVFMCTDHPHTLVCVSVGSPLIVAMDDKSAAVASERAGIPAAMTNVLTPKDGDCVVVQCGRNAAPTVHVTRLGSAVVTREVEVLKQSVLEVDMKGFSSHMLKEIMDQPNVLRSTMQGRIRAKHPFISLGGLDTVVDGASVLQHMLRAPRLIVVGCGSSYNSGLVAKYNIEEMAKIPVQVEYGGEFRARSLVHNKQSHKPVVIVLSQSGESGDTVAALRECVQASHVTFGVCNSPGSTVGRETHAGAYLHAGREVAVVSTKTVTSQITVLLMLALRLGYEKGTLPKEEMLATLEELRRLPEVMEEFLVKYRDSMQGIGKAFRYAHNFLCLGRGMNFPIALECAMKLKQVAYIHSEGYPAAEMKHGPIALIDKFMPVLFIAPRDHTYEKVLSNIREVVARKGSVVCITDEDNRDLDHLCEFVIPLPKARPCVVPLITALPVQMLALFIALGRGENVDLPRHQTKVFGSGAGDKCRGRKRSVDGELK